MTTIIECIGVGKEFKGRPAVTNLSFQIEKGEVVALLGPNGAGKSTTIQMLLGLLEPSIGRITVGGQCPKSRSVRERIGVMLQEVCLLDTVTVKEILKLVRGYYPQPLSLEQLITLTGLSRETLDTRTEKLSGGQKRRVSFALALAGDPELLVLDEPTAGMDSKARKTFWKSIGELAAQGKTIIFTTHYLEEVEYAATRVLMIHAGELVEDAAPGELKKGLSTSRISFSTERAYPVETYGTIDVADIRVEGTKVTILADDADRAVQELFTLGIVITELDVSRGTLEDVYNRLLDKQVVS